MGPDHSDRPQSPMLTDWSICMGMLSPYTAPELVGIKMRGDVTGHPYLKDGPITTSRVVAFDYGRRAMLTENRFYRLGPMSHDFKTWLRKNGYTIAKYSFNQTQIPRRNLWRNNESLDNDRQPSRPSQAPRRRAGR